MQPGRLRLPIIDSASTIRGLGAMRAIGWTCGPLLGLALFAAIASVGAVGWGTVMVASALLLAAFALYWFVRLVLAIEAIAARPREVAERTTSDVRIWGRVARPRHNSTLCRWVRCQSRHIRPKVLLPSLKGAEKARNTCRRRLPRRVSSRSSSTSAASMSWRASSDRTNSRGGEQ